MIDQCKPLHIRTLISKLAEDHCMSFSMRSHASTNKSGSHVSVKCAGAA